MLAHKHKLGPKLRVVAGLGLGAGIMYLADPERGRRRRALVNDKITALIHRMERAVEKSVRDLANRGRGAVSQSLMTLVPEHVPDDVLVDRIHSRLGRLVSHPGAIRVCVHEGRVILEGDILEADLRRLRTGLRLMHGVRAITNELKVHQEPGNVPSLQGGRRLIGDPFELMRPRWSPGTRALVGATGIGLAIWGRRRRGWVGAGLGMLGAGMLLRSVTNVGPLEGMGLDPEAPGIDLQKTTTIAAPVERVFELLVNPEKLPRVMDHVHEVRKVDEKVYHWTVLGPGGVPLSWDSEVTQIIPNELLAWRSTPGATVKNSGIVQFERTDNGGTRVHIHMRYMPPGGFIGQTVAELLDCDPKEVLDEDMVRFKSLVERGKTRVRRHKVKIEDVEDVEE